MRRLLGAMWIFGVVMLLGQSCGSNPTEPDTGNGSDEDTTVVDTPTVNKPPEIQSFVADTSFGYAPFEVTFSWSVYDPDGDPLSCNLDVNDDGNYEWVSCNPSTYSYSYNSKGLYTAKLIVTDTAGHSVYKTLTIKVCERHYESVSIPINANDTVSAYIYANYGDTLIMRIYVQDGNDVSRAIFRAPSGSTLWYGAAFVDTTVMLALPETGNYELELQNTSTISDKVYGLEVLLKQCP